MQDLPIHPLQQSTPVYDCHVILWKSESDAAWSGVVSNLPEVTATGSSERELLKKISSEFKARVLQYVQDQQEIPWQETQKPGPGQIQRWIPVHL